ncbi:SRPBCC domain-containing protein [Micromonospora sp. NPDC051296]|uniref:SRPBCC domain-containing protein n=1 Tax=Micromonospora sp. NPDC051296 TaxID=3155046 RepID=UPI003417CB46
MSTPDPMNHGAVEASRQIAAPRQVVYDAWTALEHRRQWFVGPAWTEIERSVDLRVGGTEIAHGRFADGTESIYTARYHLIEPAVRLIYAFDMHVAGSHFSVSLAGVEFEDSLGGTKLTYTEQGFFLQGDYDHTSRDKGTQGLLDQFVTHVSTLTARPGQRVSP